MVLFGKFYNMDDSTKYIMVILRVLLKSIALWPDSLDNRTILYPILLYVLTVLLLLGLSVFFIHNISDITKMASSMSTLSTTLQAFIKIPIIYIYSNELKELILIMRNDFWSPDLVGVELERSLKYSAKMVAVAMLSVYTLAVLYVVSFFSTPIIIGTGELPIPSSYPFDWHESPIYELVYFLQCYVYVLFFMHGVLGHDNLFYVIITNCVAQFELLKEVFSKMGSDEIDEINKRLNRYYGEDNRPGNGKLFYRCIEHHRKLIRVCNDLETIFTISIAAQFMASLSAICVSSYLITVVNRFRFSTVSTPVFFYAVGHLAQFFTFCVAGNELIYQTSTLSTYLFNSRWYESEVPTDVKKAISVVIQRSQKPQKLTALSMVVLNYYTFVKVLQLSFSFYTLLSSITEKKNEVRS